MSNEKIPNSSILIPNYFIPKGENLSVRRYCNTDWTRGFNSCADNLCADVGTWFVSRLACQCLSGYNFNSGTDFGVHSENYRCLCCNFNFRTLDAEFDDAILHRNYCKHTEQNWIGGEKFCDRD